MNNPAKQGEENQEKPILEGVGWIATAHRQPGQIEQLAEDVRCHRLDQMVIKTRLAAQSGDGLLPDRSR